MSSIKWKSILSLLAASLFVSTQLADFAAAAPADLKINLESQLTLPPDISISLPRETVDKSIWDLAVSKDLISNRALADVYYQLISPFAPVRWESPIGEPIISAPVVGEDGTIYVGADNKKLYAFKKDGAVKWSITLGGNSYAAPAIGPDGTIYVRTWDDRKLVAVSSGGRKLWEFALGNSSKLPAKEILFHAPPVVGADGTIYTGGTEVDGKLYAVAPNGIKKWIYDTGAPVYSIAIGADGKIYAGTKNFFGNQVTHPRIYALNPNGTLKWKSAESFAISSLSIGIDGTVYAGIEYSGIHAFNPENGSSQRIPSESGGGNIASILAGTNGYLYMADGRRLSALGPDRKLKWVTDFQYINADPIKGTKWTLPNAAIGNDGIIYATEVEDMVKDVVYKTNLKYTLMGRNAEGKVVWKYKSNEMIGKPAFGSDGTVYAAAGNKLLALGTVAASTVSLNKSKLNLEAGQTEALVPAVAPENATNKRVLWSSSNTKVAVVNDMGKVQALAPGEAKITVVTEEGGFFASCLVTVAASASVDGAAPEAPAQNGLVQNELLADVEEHWAGADIIRAIDLQFVQGYPDGTFQPERTVTRAEFTVMLMRGLKPKDAGAELVFQDAEQIADWALPSVQHAVKMGIISGYEDGTFRPDANITHTEMAIMLARASGLSVNPAGQTNFTDNAEIPNWAVPAVSKVAETGIIIVGGLPDNRFGPQLMTTRAEAASSIVRMLANR